MYRECLSIISAIALVILIVVGVASHQFLGHDNEIEEVVEEIIKEKTGVDIDLTPETKEAMVKDLKRDETDEF